MSSDCLSRNPTNFIFPSLEPAFSTYMSLVREYNLGYPRCGADEDDPWFHRFPLITYLRNVTPPDQFTDDLHQEVREEDKKWEQYEFRCNVVPNPNEQELTKFGIDEKVDVLAYPALPILEDVGLAYQAPAQVHVGTKTVVLDPNNYVNGPIIFLLSPGDRFWWNDKLFEVTNVSPWNFFGNTSIPMYVTLAASLHRPSTIDLEKRFFGGSNDDGL